MHSWKRRRGGERGKAENFIHGKSKMPILPWRRKGKEELHGKKKVQLSFFFGELFLTLVILHGRSSNLKMLCEILWKSCCCERPLLSSHRHLELVPDLTPPPPLLLPAPSGRERVQICARDLWGFDEVLPFPSPPLPPFSPWRSIHFCKKEKKKVEVLVRRDWSGQISSLFGKRTLSEFVGDTFYWRLRDAIDFIVPESIQNVAACLKSLGSLRMERSLLNKWYFENSETFAVIYFIYYYCILYIYIHSNINV